ncbi:MAG: class I adenylate-forming enzyme family protein [Bacillota bacterium]|nr:class I adenylate-forming enzyme family protein [Bacillota bacterium]
MINDIIPSKNIYELILEESLIYPDKILLSIDQEEVTYKKFTEMVDNIASALYNLGTVPKQKIALIIPNSILWYEIYWAVVKLGAHPVPFDPQIGQWEMSRLISIGDIEICFTANCYRSNAILQNLLNIRNEVPLLKTVISVQNETLENILSFDDFLNLSNKDKFYDNIYTPNEEDPLMLACTSGSTGNPKIIVVPHLGFYKSQKDMGDYLGLNENDIMLLGMPLYHQGGFGMGLQLILKGGTVLYQPTFDPIKFLKTIEQKKITIIQLTATLAKILLSLPDFKNYNLSSVRMCYFAGEVLPMEVAQIFFKQLGIRLINVIGSSETATMVVWDSKFDQDADVNEFRELSFTKLKLLNKKGAKVSEGETGTIFIHTDALINEYYKNKTETDLRIISIEGEKWFNTGDLAVQKPYGRIRFSGRAKRVIKRGANLVYPEEIEGFLLSHPYIKSIAVVGEKDELIGEMIVAYIKPRKGFEITRGEILKFCRGKLAAYKIPDQVILMDEIPNDIGKVQYKYLRQYKKVNNNDKK